MSTPDAIASSYLDDVTLTIDNSEDMLTYVRVMALYSRTRYITEGSEVQADELGQTIVDRFHFMLDSDQKRGPLGDLLRQMLGHVEVGDLGSYYLRDLDDYLTEQNVTLPGPNRSEP